MKTTLRFIFFAIISFTFHSIVFSKEPMKYGKVDMADMTMKSYPLDSTASAVILCNYGNFTALQFQYVQQIRIKILKEEGKHWGDFQLPVGEKATVKGQTYNLENGKIVISKLKKESIYLEEKIKGRFTARVAMPDVKVGSIIDIEFYYSGLPSVFEFQETIPVRWSELLIEPHMNISYRKNFSGYYPLSISTEDRWVAQDVPAFKSEKYMKSPKNYMKRVEINVASIQIPEQMIYKNYASSWESVVEMLRKDEDFGLRLSSFAFFLNNTVDKIEKSCSTPEAKLQAAYDEAKKIKWNERLSWWATGEDLSEAFKKKSGNSAQINMILMIMLRKLDIKVDPILVSTRDNGEIQPHVVSYNHFNHVIAQATIGDNVYQMDATDENLPLNMLPVMDLNGRALLIEKERFSWIDIATNKKEKTNIVYNLELTPEGLLKGICTSSKTDYSALEARAKFRTFTSTDDYLKAIENDEVGLSVKEYEARNLDSLNRSFTERYNIVLKNKTIYTDGKVYLKLQPYTDLNTNPFKMDERTYPVDFGTTLDRMVIFSVKIPQGYVVEQLPNSEKVEMPEKGASFQRLTSNSEDGIQLMYKFNINKTLFIPEQYNDLKAFFDYIIKKQTEMIVLKKS